MGKRVLRISMLLVMLLGAKVGLAQDDSFTIPNKVVVDGDTLANLTIGKIYIFPWHKFKKHRDEEKYRRLILNLKKVYPYAIMARDMLMSMEADVAKIKGKKEREKYIKDAEDRLRAQFEAPLKHLSISQGKLLLKLIDRETGRTSYSIVKELRGTFSAFCWQSLARLFGSNMKSTFDENGEDKYLNRLILMYENGQLYDV
ncbi:DUF4294 domain-containing protein [uncultured Acetobacteroides sp.]|uniref:DUF4294 domain-containing protein n=1 Tax=uncultured Acetobacteroides sp. TaxID=1760811 RepID=UPI0029F4C50D|nr:DUF4294 domain-containing protein [uncultured Acetobacteroides sp.]